MKKTSDNLKFFRYLILSVSWRQELREVLLLLTLTFCCLKLEERENKFSRKYSKYSA